MRTSTLAVVVVCSGLACLACAGLPIPGAEVTDEEAPAAGLAALDVAEETTVLVTSLEASADGCAWIARSWPDGEKVTIAAAKVACPTEWVAAADEGHAALVGAAGGALVVGDVASPVPAPPKLPTAITFSGDELQICAMLDAELREEPRRFHFGDKDYPSEDAGGLAQSLRLADGKWVVVETAPVATAGIARPCTELPSFAEGTVMSAPPLQPEEDDLAAAEGADKTQLEALQAGDWAVSEAGWYAAKTKAVEAGPDVAPPIAWRSAGGDWSLVAEVADDAVFFVYGPWLLITTGNQSRLLDARTGQQDWRAELPSAFWPEEVTVPEGRAPGAEPAPAGTAPRRAKAGHKRPGGAGKAGGKAKRPAVQPN